MLEVSANTSEGTVRITRHDHDKSDSGQIGAWNAAKSYLKTVGWTVSEADNTCEYSMPTIRVPNALVYLGTLSFLTKKTMVSAEQAAEMLLDQLQDAVPISGCYAREDTIIVLVPGGPDPEFIWPGEYMGYTVSVVCDPQYTARQQHQR